MKLISYTRAPHYFATQENDIFSSLELTVGCEDMDGRNHLSANQRSSKQG